MNVYIPLLTLAGLGLLFAVFSVSVTSLTGPKRYNRAKVDAYECGKYYLTAMMFIIFDLEIVFLYPWAVASDQLGLFGLAAIMLFLFNLTIPFVYEWRRGGLEWD